MPTSEQLAEDLESIERALASGELQVKYADRQVTYRSLADMRSIRDELARKVSGSTGKPRRRYFEFRDGSGGAC